MSKENVNIDVDGATEPLTKGNEDGLTKVQFSASPDTVRFDGKPANFTRSGLSKEELMKYANDPFWVRLRMIFFFLFWIVWFAMLIGAIIIIIVAPRCPASSRLKWYQKSAMCKFSLMPVGATNENIIVNNYGPMLKKLQSIQMDTIIVPPIQNESSFMEIKNNYGTFKHYEQFVKNASEMNLIMEFDFTRTGVDHEWFNLSEKHSDGYEDFYIWQSEYGNQRLHPSSSSMWMHSMVRNDSYLSPDGNSAYLNFRSSNLLDKLKNILAFWKAKGLKGFSLIGVDTMINVGLANKTEITLVIKELRDYIYTKIDPKGKTALMVEMNNENNLEAFVGTVRTNIADLAISQISVDEIDSDTTGKSFSLKMENHFRNLPVWNTHLKIGPWTGLTFNLTGPIQNFIEIVTMAYYMHPNCTAIPIIVDEIGDKTLAHLTILNKYRHEHIDSMLMGEVHYPLIDKKAYSIVRVHPDNEGLLLVINFDHIENKIKLSSDVLPDEFELLFNSNQLNATGKFTLSDGGLPVERGTASLFKYKPPSKK